MPIDYKKYPADWKKVIVPRILARAKNKCERCGLLNKSMVWSVKIHVKSKDGYCCNKAIWFSNSEDAHRVMNVIKFPREVKVILTIAHLDHDETNHNVDDSRLKALCQYCHLNYDAEEKNKRKLLKGKE